jgi:hypothetical protein
MSYNSQISPFRQYLRSHRLHPAVICPLTQQSDWMSGPFVSRAGHTLSRGPIRVIRSVISAASSEADEVGSHLSRLCDVGHDVINQYPDMMPLLRVLLARPTKGLKAVRYARNTVLQIFHHGVSELFTWRTSIAQRPFDQPGCYDWQIEFPHRSIPGMA